MEKFLENLTTKQKEMYNITAEIARKKRALADTDYKVLKFIEGELTEEEFAPIRQQRKAWREEINELEVNLNDLINNKEI